LTDHVLHRQSVPRMVGWFAHHPRDNVDLNRKSVLQLPVPVTGLEAMFDGLNRNAMARGKSCDVRQELMN